MVVDFAQFPTIFGIAYARQSNLCYNKSSTLENKEKYKCPQKASNVRIAMCHLHSIKTEIFCVITADTKKSS